MGKCEACGMPDQHGRFCTGCGNPMAAATTYVSLEKVRRVGPSEPTVLGPAAPGSGPTGPYPGMPPTGYPAAAPTGAYPLPSPTTPQPVPARRRQGRAAVASVVLAVAVLLLAGVGLWFKLRPVDGEAATTPTATAPTLAAGSAGPPTDPSASPTTRAAPLGPGAGKSAPSAAPAPAPAPAITVTTTAMTTVAPDPMGGPRADITCNSGFIVQVASELDETAFQNRVATLRSAGMFPTDARWTQTAAGCSLFTNQANVYVSYVGPFATWAEGCTARKASPPDAFIKSTDPGAVGTFLTCLCPASVGELPAITTVGERGVWVGELQRVLGAGLDYNVGDINAGNGDPGHWGEYTAGTAAAVGRFQADHGLPRTERVDAATWASLQSARC